MSRRILSTEQVEEIKSKYSSGLYTEKQLSEQYNCSVMTISLWLQPNPYEIIKNKRKKREIFVCIKCPICGICMKSEVCDCHEKKRYFSDFDDLVSVVSNLNRKK